MEGIKTMNNAGYVPFTHYFVKAIETVPFPITKNELVETVGDKYIFTKPGKVIMLSEILKMLVPENYECATALYCAIVATMEKYDI